MFRSAWIPLSLLMTVIAVPAFAQDVTIDTRRSEPAPIVEDGHGQSITPEMWLYKKEIERYDNPALAVRRKAELRGQRRAERIASAHWFGINNSRPIVTCTPAVGGTLAPFWAGPSFDPNRWRPYSFPTSQRSDVNRY